MKVAVLFLLLSAYANANVLFLENKGNAASKVQGIDPASYVNIGGHFYYFSPPTITLTVVEAMEFCNFDGLSLASLETEKEHTLITEYMESAGLSSSIYWTSGQRFQNTWQWAGSGQLFSYATWADGQPDEPLNFYPCVYIQNGKLYDYPCSNNGYAFICEQS